MNRKNLTAAVLAGLAGAAGIVGSAQAVNINPDGLGQVLIYPYYTVNGGNTTLLSVVNTTDEAKAVKVRFTEGQNTREVLDFNLYMSAYDVWTAALANVDGTPTLFTSDTSCTVPYIFGNGGSQAFLPFALTDGGSTDISRTTEGHFEMIEMGTMIDELTPLLDADGDPVVPEELVPSFGSAIAATHVDGVPADCQQLVDAWTDPDSSVSGDEGYWLDAPFVDLTAPSGGLFGGAAIVQVQKGAMYSYDAQAINGFANTIFANDLLHQEPGNVLPGLNSGNIMTGTVFSDDGFVLTSTGLTRGVDAVSFVFMHDQIMNEYTTEDAVAAGTEWVVTFPTKHFYVYGPSIGLLPGDTVEPVAPFTSIWDYVEADPDADPAVEESLTFPCEVVLLDSIWNREEQSIGDPGPGEPIPPIVSPAPPGIPGDPIIPFELCFETSVIRFGGPMAAIPEVAPSTEILGSTNFHSIDNTELGFQYGWARLQLDDYPHDADGSGGISDEEAALSRDELGGLEGLPVTGFAVQSFINSFLGGGSDILANYGGIFEHKATRKTGSLID